MYFVVSSLFGHLRLAFFSKRGTGLEQFLMMYLSRPHVFSYLFFFFSFFIYGVGVTIKRENELS